MNMVLLADSTVFLQQEYKESATVAHQSFEHEVRKSNLKGVAWMQGFSNLSILDFFIPSN